VRVCGGGVRGFSDGVARQARCTGTEKGTEEEVKTEKELESGRNRGRASVPTNSSDATVTPITPTELQHHRLGFSRL
jgi:hypothetical protein